MNSRNLLGLAGLATLMNALPATAMAAPIDCVITPVHSIIIEGQTLQLEAACTGANLHSINWLMGNISDTDLISVTGLVATPGHDGTPDNPPNSNPKNKLKYITPVGLGGGNEFKFKVEGAGVSGGDNVTSTVATVIVKPASAVVALAAGNATPTVPVNAQCGSANNGSSTTMPTGASQCLSGRPTLAISGPTSFSWSCMSLNGGQEANCSAQRVVQYTVSATVNGGNGTVSPASQEINGGQAALVTATPTNGFNTSWAGTCGGAPNGNTFTTNPVNSNCTVTASFTTAPPVINGSCGSANGSGPLTSAPTSGLCSAGTPTAVQTLTSSYDWTCAGSNGGTTASCSATRSSAPPPMGGSDPGSGFWLANTNRLIASQSGASTATTSYVPGCLNGDNATSSGVGCAAVANNLSAETVFGSGFSFGSGRILGVRYTPKANAGSSVKAFQVRSGDGGNVGQALKVWLSTDPQSTFEGTATACRDQNSTVPRIITGPGYCPISQPTSTYYLLIQADENAANPPTFRYQIQEGSADFN